MNLGGPSLTSLLRLGDGTEQLSRSKKGTSRRTGDWTWDYGLTIDKYEANQLQVGENGKKS